VYPVLCMIKGTFAMKLLC